MGLPEIITNPRLEIYESLRLGSSNDVYDAYLNNVPIVPFDDLWLEFTEDDTGLSAPLPAGWSDTLYMHLSWRGLPTEWIVRALREAWAGPPRPGVTRFELFVMRLDAHQGASRGEAMPEYGGAERELELARRRDAFRVTLAEKFGRAIQGEREASARRHAERAERRAGRAARAQELRQVGAFVRRRRHETEEPAPVHRYDCPSLTKQYEEPFYPERYEGFKITPAGALACRSCHPQEAREP